MYLINPNIKNNYPIQILEKITLEYYQKHKNSKISNEDFYIIMDRKIQIFIEEMVKDAIWEVHNELPSTEPNKIGALIEILKRDPSKIPQYHFVKSTKKHLEEIKFERVFYLPPDMLLNRKIISVNIHRDLRAIYRNKYKNINSLLDPVDFFHEILKELLINTKSSWDKYYSNWIRPIEISEFDLVQKYGKIDWFDKNKGYGLITAFKNEFFFHEMKNEKSILANLNAGDWVSFIDQPRKRKTGVEAIIIKKEKIKKMYPLILEFLVVGFSHGNRQKIIFKLEKGDSLSISREPDNVADPNAIRVDSKDGSNVGYINKDIARLIHGWLDNHENKIYGFVGNKYKVRNTDFSQVSVIFPILGNMTKEEREKFYFMDVMAYVN